TSAFHQLLAGIEVSLPDTYHAELWYRFFKTIDAWNHGARAPLEAECAELPAQMAAEAHPLLPGPYFGSCLPWCSGVIFGRAVRAPVDPRLVDLFVDGLTQLVLFAPCLISAVCLAQHVWLADRRRLARLKAALAATGPLGDMHGL